MKKTKIAVFTALAVCVSALLSGGVVKADEEEMVQTVMSTTTPNITLTSQRTLVESFSASVDIGTSSLAYELNPSGNIGIESFWVTADGKIFVLDSKNRRIAFKSEGTVQFINLEGASYPEDMLCCNELFYVLDGCTKEKLIVYDKEGSVVDSLDLAPFNIYPDRLMTDGSMVIVRNAQRIKDIQISLQDGELTGQEVEVNELARTSSYTYATRLKEENGYIYYLNCNLVPNCSYVRGEQSLSCEVNGSEIGNYIIPTDEFVCSPEQFIRIVNQTIYIMIPSTNAVNIYQVTLGTQNVSNMESITREALAMEAAQMQEQSQKVIGDKASVNSVISLSRAVVRGRALAMANYSWTLTTDNLNKSTVSSSMHSSVIFPVYIQKIIDKGELANGSIMSMNGIPYCWGGFMSQYSKSDGMYFHQGIAAGYTAGNISTNSESYVSGTAGLDCSGMVSAAYGLSQKKGTKGNNGFVAFGNQISHNDVQQMDFFVKEGHIFLFDQWVNQSAGVMQIIEANSTSDTGKVVVRTVTFTTLYEYQNYVARTPW